MSKNTTTTITDIVLAKIDDLIVQATRERSHYYVKSVLEECKSLIKLQAETQTKYYELLMAVGNRYRGETRHETALKYIKRAEEVNGLGLGEAVIDEKTTL